MLSTGLCKHCNATISFLFAFLLVPNVADAEAAHDMCKVTKCNRHGPPVRFPFWLKDKQSPHCGFPHPGFELACTKYGKTVLHLPWSVEMFVEDIDYKTQSIFVSDPEGCLNRQLPHLDLNFSASPFNGFFGLPDSYTLFNCAKDPREDYLYYGNCAGYINGFQIRAVSPSSMGDQYSLIKCRKVVDISAVPFELINTPNLNLSWSKPICFSCEEEGKSCRLKNNTQGQTECYGNPKNGHPYTKLKRIVAGVIPTSFLLALIVIALYKLYHLHKTKEESQLKIEEFLEDYRSLKPSRYSYTDIKRITNQFKEKLGEGGYGTVFKGRLSTDVLVAVKVLNNFKGNGEEFINEVGSMSRIHHVNVARLVGFCADGYKRALVYEYLPNESLEKFIFSAKGEGHFLGWDKLQDIALGIAKGIEYLHQGCEQRILHFDIKPHNILLDHNFTPKISDFGLAKLCSKEQSAVSMTAARGTMGYIAPEVLSRNFGNVSYKSDVYSFGMLLLEMVGGRKNIDVTVENTSQVYFPEWVYNHLDKGEELGIRIEDERQSLVARKLSIVGLWCIQWFPVDRPSMKAVIQMLEGEANSLTMPPNPFASTDHMKLGGSKYKKPVGTELAIIAE
ncbi:rust resistance kinase Lr10-like [Herrania umbratica]|uniref:Rust resistance kinase Lr10-like n=1 Tax=Herrania umbratica TaxID=108875 RepID=A0A6J1B1Q9_9ROSI|nr:rust resistance kinase Lr10-like [Herrania umbratica]